MFFRLFAQRENSLQQIFLYPFYTFRSQRFSMIIHNTERMQHSLLQWHGVSSWWKGSNRWELPRNELFSPPYIHYLLVPLQSLLYYSLAPNHLFEPNRTSFDLHITSIRRDPVSSLESFPPSPSRLLPRRLKERWLEMKWQERSMVAVEWIAPREDEGERSGQRRELPSSDAVGDWGRVRREVSTVVHYHFIAYVK